MFSSESLLSFIVEECWIDHDCIANLHVIGIACLLAEMKSYHFRGATLLPHLDEALMVIVLTGAQGGIVTHLRVILETFRCGVKPLIEGASFGLVHYLTHILGFIVGAGHIVIRVIKLQTVVIKMSTIICYLYEINENVINYLWLVKIRCMLFGRSKHQLRWSHFIM